MAHRQIALGQDMVRIHDEVAVQVPDNDIVRVQENVAEAMNADMVQVGGLADTQPYRDLRGFYDRRDDRETTPVNEAPQPRDRELEKLKYGHVFEEKDPEPSFDAQLTLIGKFERRRLRALDAKDNWLAESYRVSRDAVEARIKREGCKARSISKRKDAALKRHRKATGQTEEVGVREYFDRGLHRNDAQAYWLREYLPTQQHQEDWRRVARAVDNVPRMDWAGEGLWRGQYQNVGVDYAQQEPREVVWNNDPWRQVYPIPERELRAIREAELAQRRAQEQDALERLQIQEAQRRALQNEHAREYVRNGLARVTEDTHATLQFKDRSVERHPVNKAHLPFMRVARQNRRNNTARVFGGRIDRPAPTYTRHEFRVEERWVPAGPDLYRVTYIGQEV